MVTFACTRMLTLEPKERQSQLQWPLPRIQHHQRKHQRKQNLLLKCVKKALMKKKKTWVLG